MMSNEVAAGIAIALYAGGIATVLLICRYSRPFSRFGGLIALLFPCLAVVQTGLFARSSLAPTEVLELVPTTTDLSRCEEMFDALTQMGLLVGDLQSFYVRGDIWRQLPAVVHDTVSQCAAQAQGKNEVEIIVR